jgi:hypothetical protein
MAQNFADIGYITEQLQAFYASIGVTPGPPGSGGADIAYYAGVIAASSATPGVAGTYGWFGGNIGYWQDRIQRDLKGGSGAAGGGAGAVGSSGPVNANPNGNLLTPQLGLLEDDLAYRLSLLCVNVLQPLKDEYPNIVVIGGFRQTNSGIGQHEIGEAVDLQIKNQSDPLLYTVADFIQKNLNFDQLILNFTNIGDKLSWIHVSFSAKSLRGQVLTKDFSDTFHQGLFLVTPMTGEAAAQVLRAQAIQDATILAELQNIQTRQQRLGQTPSVIASTTAEVSAAGASLAAAPGIGPAQLAQVDGVIYPLGNGWDAASPEAQLLGQLLSSGNFGQPVIDSILAQFPKSGAIYYPSNNIYAVRGFYTALDKTPNDVGGAWDLILH